MRKRVPKLWRELPEGPSDLESLDPQTIHLPLDAPPFLNSAPFSSHRGGCYKFRIIRLEVHGLSGAPWGPTLSLKMRRRRGKCQWEVDFNLCSWSLVSGFRRLMPLVFAAGTEQRWWEAAFAEKGEKRKKFCALLLRPLMTQSNNTGCESGFLGRRKHKRIKCCNRIGTTTQGNSSCVSFFDTLNELITKCLISDVCIIQIWYLMLNL